jgi:hypothetical protein
MQSSLSTTSFPLSGAPAGEAPLAPIRNDEVRIGTGNADGVSVPTDDGTGGVAVSIGPGADPLQPPTTPASNRQQTALVIRLQPSRPVIERRFERWMPVLREPAVDEQIHSNSIVFCFPQI